MRRDWELVRLLLTELEKEESPSLGGCSFEYIAAAIHFR